MGPAMIDATSSSPHYDADADFLQLPVTSGIMHSHSRAEETSRDWHVPPPVSRSVEFPNVASRNASPAFTSPAQHEPLKAEASEVDSRLRRFGATQHMFSFPPIARPVYDELVESSSVPSSSPSRIFTSSPVKSPNKSNPGDSPMLPSVSHTPASSPRKHDFSGTRQSSQPISVPPLRSPDTVSVGAIGRWPASAQIGEYPDFTRTFVELNPPPAAHTLPSLAGIFRQAHVFPADLPLSSPPPAMHSPVRSLPASQNSWRSLSNEDVPVDEEKQSPYVQDNFLARQIKPLHDATLLNTIGQPDTAKPVASYHSITTDVVPVQAPGLSDHVSRTESLNKVSSTLTKAPCLPSETREDQAPLDDPPACDPTSRKRKAPTDEVFDIRSEVSGSTWQVNDETSDHNLDTETPVPSTLTRSAPFAEDPVIRPPSKKQKIPPTPPNTRRLTPSVQRLQNKKLAAPFRSPLRQEAQAGTSAAGSSTPTRSKSPPSDIHPFDSSPIRPSSSLLAPIGASLSSTSRDTRATASHAKKDYTPRAASQFRSPFKRTASGITTAPPPAFSSTRLTPAVQALEARVQILKRAVKITESEASGAQKPLEELMLKWRTAGRDVAREVWALVKDQPKQDAVRWPSEPGPCSSGWGWEKDEEAHAAPQDSREREPKDQELQEPAEDTIGTMLRQLRIGPATLGWDEDECDFVD